MPVAPWMAVQAIPTAVPAEQVSVLLLRTLNPCASEGEVRVRGILDTGTLPSYWGKRIFKFVFCPFCMKQENEVMSFTVARMRLLIERYAKEKTYFSIEHMRVFA